MKIQSRFFGEIEIEEDKILAFPSGLIGMKQLKRFVLRDTENEKPFQWLLALDDPNISFLTIEPRLMRPQYKVAVQRDDLARLAITKETKVLVLAFVTLYREPRVLTANLQGPLVINTEQRLGKQIVLMEGQYNARHDILEEMSKAKSAGPGGPEETVVEIRNSK